MLSCMVKGLNSPTVTLGLACHTFRAAGAEHTWFGSGLHLRGSHRLSLKSSAQPIRNRQHLHSKLMNNYRICTKRCRRRTGDTYTSSGNGSDAPCRIHTMPGGKYSPPKAFSHNSDDEVGFARNLVGIVCRRFLHLSLEVLELNSRSKAEDT